MPLNAPRSGWLFVAAACALSGTGLANDPADLSRYDARIKPEDRAHWSYQPIREPPVAAVKNLTWPSNPIDAFVLARLEAKGWQPAAPAEPRALLRRLYLDIIGLPPTLEEQETFVRDPSPLRLERVIRDLLSRPAYGERWGRHWLDLVRYAETNGYERDGTKPMAWRYRDYVIGAFNADKPYDRFILEQLAGDELPDASAETFIATGFNRLGPWDDEPADPKQDRFDQLDDVINTTSQVFLGLTLACARCHDHKFDALSTLDYYRMAAVFNTLQRPQWERLELDRPAGTRTELAVLEERDRKIAALGRQNLDRCLTTLGRLIAARPSPSSPWTTAVALQLSAGERELLAANATKIRRLRQATPDLPRGYFLYEPGPKPAAMHLLIRGSAARPGPQVQPGMPAVLVSTQPRFPDPDALTSRRRLALARWIASPENPLTARVIVNRVWQYHFGEGLVRTSSDFGKNGDPPTHPELLEWLAARFVRDGWSLKKLHYLILSSSTFRMSKHFVANYARDDPEDRLLWRFPSRRLEAEVIRDSMLAVSGRLNRKMYGPSMYPHVPIEALAGHSDPDKIWPPFDEPQASRRTVYAFLKRSMIVPMLEVLDLCDTTRSTSKRAVTTVAPQALSLFNGDFVNRQARHLADRLVRVAGDEPARQIDRAYRLALCRPPNEQERTEVLRFLQEDKDRRRALEQVCRVILNLNEFVYPE